jgi:exopolysaccharide production protein ExoZ
VAGWRSYLNAIVLVWLGLIGFVPLFIGWDDNILLYHVYSIWLAAANVAFAGGLLIPWIIGKIRIPVGTGILALCVVMVVMPTNFTTARWAVGVAATLLVLDAIRIKLPARVILGLPTLGDWSYALYLAHVPCILVTYHFWSASAGIGAAWLSAIGVALVVSAGFGILDTEMYRRLKLAVDGATENRLRRWVGAFAGVFVLASLIGMVVT